MEPRRHCGRYGGGGGGGGGTSALFSLSYIFPTHAIVPLLSTVLYVLCYHIKHKRLFALLFFSILYISLHTTSIAKHSILHPLDDDALNLLLLLPRSRTMPAFPTLPFLPLRPRLHIFYHHCLPPLSPPKKLKL